MTTDIYMTKIYPGFFSSETFDVKVDTESLPEFIDARCYGIRFFKKKVLVFGDEKLEGRKYDITGIFYLGGEVYDLDRVKRENHNGEFNTLVSNMVSNKWNTVIKTRFGQFNTFCPEDGDVLIPVTVKDSVVYINDVRSYLPEELFNVD